MSDFDPDGHGHDPHDDGHHLGPDHHDPHGGPHGGPDDGPHDGYDDVADPFDHDAGHDPAPWEPDDVHHDGPGLHDDDGGWDDDLGADDDPDDPDDDRADADGPIDLRLDHEPADGDSDPDDDADDADGDAGRDDVGLDWTDPGTDGVGDLEVDLALDGHLHGDLDAGLLGQALAAVGSDHAADVLDGLHLDVLAPRDAVGLLDDAGIAARVEHSDIGTLVESVDAGGEVLLVGAERSWAVTSVDVAGDVVHLEAVDGDAGADTTSVSLRDLADAWGRLDHEALVVPPPAGAITLGGDALVVAIDPGDLLPPLGSDRV